ncbi:MAG: LysR family transcriptional regulator [Bacilli bacterium]|nr:LysR family transcriptional regulator [Bacilli bacterium]
MKDFFKYYYFTKTVDNNNNITKTSRELCLSHSTLSKAIKDIECKHNVTLFERNNNILLLTNTGKEIYKSFSNIYKKYQLFQSTIDNKNKTIISMPPLIQKVIGYNFLDLYTKNISKDDIIFKENNISQIINLLNLGIIDITLSNKKINNSKYISKLIYQDSFSIITNIHNTKHHYSIIDQDILDNKIISYGSETSVNHQIYQYYRKLNRNFNLSITSCVTDFLLNVINNNKEYYFLIPNSLIKKISNITDYKILKLNSKIKWKIYINYKKELSEIISKILNNFTSYTNEQLDKY